jgi:hypothetical protein
MCHYEGIYWVLWKPRRQREADHLCCLGATRKGLQEAGFQLCPEGGAGSCCSEAPEHRGEEVMDKRKGEKNRLGMQAGRTD